MMPVRPTPWRPKLAQNWGKVPKRAAAVLGPRALRVLVVIAAYADKNGVAYPSLDRIIADTGMQRSRVAGAIAELEEGEFLRRLRGGGRGRANRYQLILDSPETGCATDTVVGDETGCTLETVSEQKQGALWHETGCTLAHKQGAFCTPEQTIEQKEEQKEREGALRAPRSTRLPDDFIMPSEWVEDAGRKRAEHGLPPIDLRLAAESFCNYWRSKAGKGAAKRDWHATWINWALKERPPPDRPRRNGGIRRGGAAGRHVRQLRGYLQRPVRSRENPDRHRPRAGRPAACSTPPTPS
jgi:hypothetical protein